VIVKVRERAVNNLRAHRVGAIVHLKVFKDLLHANYAPEGKILVQIVCVGHG